MTTCLKALVTLLDVIIEDRGSRYRLNKMWIDGVMTIYVKGLITPLDVTIKGKGSHLHNKQSS